MLCEKCGKNIATTHIHTVINGVATTKHLCQHCAATNGEQQNSLANMFSSMFSELLNTGTFAKSKTCGVCGTLFSDIAKSGKAGCPQCYNTFFDELLPYIKRVHGSTVHMGKIPDANVQSTTLVAVQNPKEKKLEDLKKALKSHIEKEEYELAAKVRDEIRILEKEEK